MVGEGAVARLSSREAVPAGGDVVLRALFTPGHEDDHVCYYLPGERVMFTGDTILGASSSTVRNLSDYMKSLEVLAQYKPETICPGHGPVVAKGARRIQFYIRHRQERERQVLEALQQGQNSVEQIVSYVYPRNLRRELRQGAARNVQTHLSKLLEESRVTATGLTYAINGR